VKVLLDARAFSYFDATSHAWRIGPGDFTVFVGQSVDQIELKGNISAPSAAIH
jgi:hypothetical protein